MKKIIVSGLLGFLIVDCLITRIERDLILRVGGYL